MSEQGKNRNSVAATLNRLGPLRLTNDTKRALEEAKQKAADQIRQMPEYSPEGIAKRNETSHDECPYVGTS